VLLGNIPAAVGSSSLHGNARGVIEC